MSTNDITNIVVGDDALPKEPACCLTRICMAELVFSNRFSNETSLLYLVTDNIIEPQRGERVETRCANKMNIIRKINTAD